VFFFSSRRRHTRSKRDWSSDVCSSDLYGTPKDYVMEQLERGHDVFLEIEVQGAMQVKQNYPQGVFIFLCPPSLQELKNRISGRGTETQELLTSRLQQAK